MPAHSTSAHYRIVMETTEAVVLQDCAAWGQYSSVTNAAPSVVFELERLLHGRRLFYFASDGELGELLVAKDHRGYVKFAGFAPANAVPGKPL